MNDSLELGEIVVTTGGVTKVFNGEEWVQTKLFDNTSLTNVVDCASTTADCASITDEVFYDSATLITVADFSFNTIPIANSTVVPVNYQQRCEEAEQIIATVREIMNVPDGESLVDFVRVRFEQTGNDVETPGHAISKALKLI